MRRKDRELITRLRNRVVFLEETIEDAATDAAAAKQQSRVAGDLVSSLYVDMAILANRVTELEGNPLSPRTPIYDATREDLHAGRVNL